MSSASAPACPELTSMKSSCFRRWRRHDWKGSFPGIAASIRIPQHVENDRETPFTLSSPGRAASLLFHDARLPAERCPSHERRRLAVRGSGQDQGRDGRLVIVAMREDPAKSRDALGLIDNAGCSQQADQDRWALAGSSPARCRCSCRDHVCLTIGIGGMKLRSRMAFSFGTRCAEGNPMEPVKAIAIAHHEGRSIRFTSGLVVSCPVVSCASRALTLCPLFQGSYGERGATLARDETSARDGPP